MKSIVTTVVASLFLAALPLAQAEDVAETETVEADDDMVKVTLLKPGDEPRRKLRYEFDADTTEHLDVTMKMGMTMSMGGRAMPKQVMPAIVQSIEIQPISVKNGIMEYRFTLAKMDVIAAGANPMVVQSMEAAVNGVVGLAGTGTVDDRGFSEGNEVEMPENASPAMLQQIKGFSDTMSRVSSPLPEEAVGVGAEWKVDLPIAMNGVKMKGGYTYTLVSMDEDSVKTRVVTAMSAKDQAVNDPNLPPGAKVTINNIKGDGEGDVEFRLKSMTPLTDIAVKIVQDATISMGDQPGQDMGMEIDMKMNLAPGKPVEEDAEKESVEEDATEKEAEPVAN